MHVYLHHLLSAAIASAGTVPTILVHHKVAQHTLPLHSTPHFRARHGKYPGNATANALVCLYQTISVCRRLQCLEAAREGRSCR